MRDSQIMFVGIFAIVACALIFTVVGDMKEKFVVAANTVERHLPPVVVEPRSMHLFAENRCSPACCDQSNFSCSTGCICMSEAQRMALSTRGNNASNKDSLSG